MAKILIGKYEFMAFGSSLSNSRKSFLILSILLQYQVEPWLLPVSRVAGMGWVNQASTNVFSSQQCLETQHIPIACLDFQHRQISFISGGLCQQNYCDFKNKINMALLLTLWMIPAECKCLIPQSIW